MLYICTIPNLNSFLGRNTYVPPNKKGFNKNSLLFDTFHIAQIKIIKKPKQGHGCYGIDLPDCNLLPTFFCWVWVMSIVSKNSYVPVFISGKLCLRLPWLPRYIYACGPAAGPIQLWIRETCHLPTQNVFPMVSSMRINLYLVQKGLQSCCEFYIFFSLRNTPNCHSFGSDFGPIFHSTHLCKIFRFVFILAITFYF